MNELTTRIIGAVAIAIAVGVGGWALTMYQSDAIQELRIATLEQKTETLEAMFAAALQERQRRDNEQQKVDEQHRLRIQALELR